MKKLRITIENKSYDVTVELLEGGAPLASAPVRTSSPIVTASVSAPASTPAPAPRGDAAPGDVISPLAGKIVSVDVKVGDAVKEGAQVLTIEAMKMNTYIYAPKSGTVTAVSAAPGDGVQEGALLLKISYVCRGVDATASAPHFSFPPMFMEREGSASRGGRQPALDRTVVCDGGLKHRPTKAPWRYEVLPTVDSTNTYAARLPAWSAVRADTQSKGRGRTTDRVWVSDRGGLWLSAVLPCPGPRARWETLPLVAGHAVIAAVAALGVGGARLRWPNDVMVGTAKLAGLLVERHTADTAVVGIGLNVFNDPATLDPKLRGHSVSLAELWTAGGPPASDASGGRAARGPLSVDDVAAVVLQQLREAHGVLANEGFETIGRALNDAWGEPRLVEVTLSASETTNTPRLFWFHGVDGEGRLRVSHCRAGSPNPAANDTNFLLLTANDVALFREADAATEPGSGVPGLPISF